MINNEVALRNTYDMLRILTADGCRCWVQDGTLLGLVRDGRTIRWDHDTDIGLIRTSWKPESRFLLEQAGFTLRDELGSEKNGWQHRWVRDGVKTDIFFYYENGDGTIWHAAYLRKVTQYRFTYQPFPLTVIETSAGPMPAPNPPEHFLEVKYGPDWRTPVRRWHFAVSPLNSSKGP